MWTRNQVWTEGMVGGGGAKLLDDWIAAGNAPVRVPLFKCYEDIDGYCCDAQQARISGFGCFTLDSPPWDKRYYPSAQHCQARYNETIQKSIHATVDCTCTISCGSAGGLPDQDDATIPVLFQ